MFAVFKTDVLNPLDKVNVSVVEVNSVLKSSAKAAGAHVRFPPDSDRTADIAGGPFGAKMRHPQDWLNVKEAANQGGLCGLTSS
jgi:hypothetical protein